MNNLSNLITSHPEVNHGKPVFAGTHVPIEFLMDYARIGMTVDEFLKDFPSVARDQAREVLSIISNPKSAVAGVLQNVAAKNS
jgi:uncharacterized protein (DUF433 family)